MVKLKSLIVDCFALIVDCSSPRLLISLSRKACAGNGRNPMVNHSQLSILRYPLSIVFVYDGANNRIQQVDYTGAQAATTTYTNDVTGLAQVLLASDGSTTTTNLFGLDLIFVDDGTTPRTMLADGLGSVRVEMVGDAVETITTYEPFGKLLAQTGTSGTTYGYTGEAHDAATGLVYLRARYYNPSLNHFQSRDPFIGYNKLPQSQNGFSYAHNNPVMFTDPTGNCIVMWSGELRMNQYPYGTSGICANTETEIAEWRANNNCPVGNIAICINNQNTAYSNQSTPNWDHDAPFLNEQLFDKYTPDAFVLGTSASVTAGGGPIPIINRLNVSGICGVDLLLGFNEFPSIFIYAGGAGGGTKIPKTNFGLSTNYTPVGAGLVWELNGHKNYQGLYQTLNIDASAVVGGEANLFRSPGAVPFVDKNPGSWGFTVAPNVGGGGSIAVNETCFVEVTTWSFLYNLFTRNFTEIIAPCKTP